MSFTSIILIIVGLLLLGVIIGFLVRSKGLSIVCGALAVLIFIFGLLVATVFLCSCE